MLNSFSSRPFAGEMGDEKSDAAARDLKEQLLQKAIDGTLQDTQQDINGFVNDVLASHYKPAPTPRQRYAVVKSMPLVTLPVKDMEDGAKEELNQTLKSVVEILSSIDA